MIDLQQENRKIEICDKIIINALEDFYILKFKDMKNIKIFSLNPKIGEGYVIEKITIEYIKFFEVDQEDQDLDEKQAGVKNANR